MYKLRTNFFQGSELKVIIRKNVDGSETSFGEYPGNSDYEAYLRWLEKGNEPLPADEVSNGGQE